MSDYGQSLFEAVFRFPLRAAFALLPARGERLGHTPTRAAAGDKASLAKRAEVKAWLHENYQITKAHG